MNPRDVSRVARFLRGLAEHRARADDIYISSYPRSGTTWLQQVLLVLANDGEPDFAHVDDVAPWFERSLALGTRRASDFASLPSPRIFKSHLPLMWLPRGARYVYVTRDGRDVAVSYHHLYRSHLDFRDDFDAFFERFLTGRLQYGSWFKHVAGWRAMRERPGVVWLEYETLRQDLTAAMLELDEQLGLGRGPQRITKLANLCTFEHMKANEQRFDHATAPRAGRGNADGRFIREGRCGAFADVLTPGQLRAFETAARRKRRLPWLELALPAFLH
jgi:LPS sulfotransferase NodH